MKKCSFAVIIPAYKNEKTIVKDLAKCEKTINKISPSSEIICVVDGMDDKTYEMAAFFVGKKKRIKLLGYSKNQGKGYAVRLGMLECKADIIAFLDAGSEINPKAIVTAYNLLSLYNADIVIGSKRHPDSSVSYPTERKFLSRAYQFLIKLLFDLNVSDTQVGLKIFQRKVLEKVLPKMSVKGFAFDIELLAVANKLGFNKIYESPIDLKLNFKGITSNFFISAVLKTLLDTMIVYYRLKFTNFYE